MIDLQEEETSSSLQDAMTPMIDVIFVLIAFMMLMINAPLITMKVDLPKAVEKPTLANVDKNVVTIGILQDDESWQVNDETANSIDELKALLGKQKEQFPQQLSVVVQSDRKVPMERMVILFATLQSLELNVSHLAMQQ